MFDLSFDILLYDLTRTYFEDQCAGNDMASRTNSRSTISVWPYRGCQGY